MSSPCSLRRWVPPLLPAGLAAVALLVVFGAVTVPSSHEGIGFEISFPRERSVEARDGGIILIVPSKDGEEPRFQ